MKSRARSRQAGRTRRRARIGKKLRGTAERPRLVVFRSLRHIEGQLVDDDRGVTLLGVSSHRDAGGEVEEEGRRAKLAQSYRVGKALAERAREEGVETVVFDRGGYPYHGRVKAFAEGARAGGLRF